MPVFSQAHLVLPFLKAAGSVATLRSRDGTAVFESMSDDKTTFAFLETSVEYEGVPLSFRTADVLNILKRARPQDFELYKSGNHLVIKTERATYSLPLEFDPPTSFDSLLKLQPINTVVLTPDVKKEWLGIIPLGQRVEIALEPPTVSLAVSGTIAADWHSDELQLYSDEPVKTALAPNKLAELLRTAPAQTTLGFCKDGPVIITGSNNYAALRTFIAPLIDD